MRKEHAAERRVGVHQIASGVETLPNFGSPDALAVDIENEAKAVVRIFEREAERALVHAHTDAVPTMTPRKAGVLLTRAVFTWFDRESSEPNAACNPRRGGYLTFNAQTGALLDGGYADCGS